MLLDFKYIPAGTIASARGLDGSISVRHQLLGKNPFARLRYVFLSLKEGSYLPYFITSANSAGNGETIIKLESIDTPEEAKKLTGASIFLTTEQYHHSQPKDTPAFFVGFKVTDKQKGYVGEITVVEELAGQVLAHIRHPKGDFIVPINDQTLISANAAREELLLDIPDGLMDIYL